MKRAHPARGLARAAFLLLSLAGGGCSPGTASVTSEEDSGIYADAGPDIAVGVDDVGAPSDSQVAPADADAQTPQLPPSVELHPVVVFPEADAHVQSGSGAAKSFGTEASMWIDQDLDGTVTQGYMRFRVGKVGVVARAVLHLYVTKGSTNSVDVSTISDTTFAETVTWSTKPAVDGKLIASLQATTDATWVELDVTAHVRAESVLSIALVPRSTDGLGIATRESAAHRPKLVLDIGADVPPNAVVPEVDTCVRSGSFADQSFGKLRYLDVDGEATGTVKQAFLRFRVGAVAAIERAALRLYLLDGSGASASVVSIADSTFADSITWNTKPAVTGKTLASLSATTRGWVEIDVTGSVAPSSTLSLALLPASSDGIRIASSESDFYRPLLVLTTRKATCGDGRCDAGETCDTCKADCGACPTGCLSGELLAMRGDLHDHTGNSDGADKSTPADAFTAARSKLDFLIVTDHVAQVSSSEWSGCVAQAKAADAPGTFVAACAWETWIGPGLGHANVLFSSTLGSVPNASSYATWYTKLAACSGCVGQMNHPASASFPWASFAYSAKAAANLALYEYNGGGYFADKIAKYASALDSGWHLAPTWNSDTHKANWGAAAQRSGFWVTAFDRAALAEAMRDRRSFASSDTDAALRVRAGACWPGSSLPKSSIEHVEVLATDPTDGFDRVVLVGAGGKTLKIFPCDGQRVCSGTTPVQVAAATYVFAYAIQKDGGTLIAAPVWLTP
jgi:hypothetical protein